MPELGLRINSSIDQDTGTNFGTCIVLRVNKCCGLET